jgi:hypothetical protein
MVEIAEGLVEDDREIHYSSLLDLRVHSSSGRWGRRRGDLVPPAVGLDHEKLLPAERTGVFILNYGGSYLCPLANAVETEVMVASID